MANNHSLNIVRTRYHNLVKTYQAVVNQLPISVSSTISIRKVLKVAIYHHTTWLDNMAKLQLSYETVREREREREKQS